jgi:hypothetical protein
LHRLAGIDEHGSDQPAFAGDTNGFIAAGRDRARRRHRFGDHG